ncbi:MAG: FadR family transcriptional regulator [Desulfobacteraceae bacterium]|nr:FadR family transcriptional regulator [Desulfobacteraceae bacterium]
MRMKLKPIKPKRISDQVFDQVREFILRGTLKPGDKVMTERELAAAMNVSRTAVRDAIKKLVAQGLLEQKQGKGTFVCEPVRGGSILEQLMDTEKATLPDLLEVRMGLECNAAAIAAQKATERDHRLIEESVAAMKNCLHGGCGGSEADVSFHMALSFATGNPLQVYLMKQIHNILSTGICAVLKKLHENPDNIRKIIRQHEEILASIKAGNAEKAYGDMREHIGFIIEFSAKSPVECLG